VGGPSNRPTIESPIRYVIRVRGALAPEWAERLGRSDGLQCVTAGEGAPSAGAASELRGVAPDQTALLDLLTILDDWALPLLEVTCARGARRHATQALDE
jgi:hypothetical protein